MKEQQCIPPRDSNGFALTVCAEYLYPYDDAIVGTIPTEIGLLTKLREFID